MIVLVDLDNTCNDFTNLFAQYVEDRGYTFDRSKYTTWHIDRAVVGHDKPKVLVNSILKDMSFWKNLQIRPGCRTALKNLIDRGYDVHVATALWVSNKDNEEVKRDWVRKNLPFIRTIHFSEDKSALTGSIIIDDKPSTLEKCNETKVTVKAIQPYNTAVDSDFSFKNWNEIPRIFDMIEALFE